MKYRMVASLFIGVVVVLLNSFPMAAQLSDVARHTYVTAATVPTAVPGVYTYPEPPANFNKIQASDEDLAKYGLPPRPADKNSRAYKDWVRAMSVPFHLVNNMREMPESHGPAKPAKGPAGALSNGPTQFISPNWSGSAVTNTAKTWTTTNFGYVYQVWNVPAAITPFGAPCSDGSYWYESSWDGLDGAFGKEGDVVQGGTTSFTDGYCDGIGPSYWAWVEWYPSYNSIFEFYVNPGDDMYVESYDTEGGTNPGNVYVEDITLQIAASVSLTYVSGPAELGSSAEWIVERPCCIASGDPYPLTNYIYDFFDDTFATNVAGTVEYYPGSTAASTQEIFMSNDAGSEVISYPIGLGTTGFQGKYSIWFSDDNCAYSGGCVE